MEKWTLSSLAVSLACGALVACGGSGNASVFVPDEAGSGQTVSEDASTPQLTGNDAGGTLLPDAEPPCLPSSVATFTPEWKKPNAAASGACSSAQIAAYYDACLDPNSNAAGCTTFSSGASNKTCVSCLATDDTAPQYGPVIWHDNNFFFTINSAGCIADQQDDMSDAGCGAAYQALVTCKEQACSACLSAENSDFDRYTTCKNSSATETECTGFIQTLDTVCGAALKDASSPIAICTPPSSDSAKDAYLQIAPIFCGQ
jgi:hypothetical protein